MGVRLLLDEFRIVLQIFYISLSIISPALRKVKEVYTKKSRCFSSKIFFRINNPLFSSSSVSGEVTDILT